MQKGHKKTHYVALYRFLVQKGQIKFPITPNKGITLTPSSLYRSQMRICGFFYSHPDVAIKFFHIINLFDSLKHISQLLFVIYKLKHALHS